MRISLLLFALLVAVQLVTGVPGPTAAPLDPPQCPAAVNGNLDNSRHFLFGRPLGTPETNDLVIRMIYELSSNDQTKFADWVAYCLDYVTVVRDAVTSRNWKADPKIHPDQTLEPNDYKGAWAELKTDRGHQAPLASFKGTPYWAETNYLSNITPQKSALNQGPWKDLEEAVRDVVETGNVVYVITGTLYEREMPLLPGADEPHEIPSGYWKIIAMSDSSDGSTVQAVSFILDQETPRSADFKDYIVTIDEIESWSGLDLFPAMSGPIENALEATKGVWPIEPQSDGRTNPVVSEEVMTDPSPSQGHNLLWIGLALAAVVGLALVVLLGRR